MKTTFLKLFSLVLLFFSANLFGQDCTTPPVGLTFVSATNTSVTFTFDGDATSRTYEIRAFVPGTYMPSDISNGIGFGTADAGTGTLSITCDFLDPDTNYDFSIRALCDGQTPNVSQGIDTPVNASTLAPPTIELTMFPATINNVGEAASGITPTTYEYVVSNVPLADGNSFNFFPRWVRPASSGNPEVEIFGNSFTITGGSADATDNGNGTFSQTFTFTTPNFFNAPIDGETLTLRAFGFPGNIAANQVSINVEDPTLSISSADRNIIDQYSLNPTTNIISFSSSFKTSTYSVADLSGAIVKTVKATGILNVSDLPSGIYFLITDEGVSKFQKK